MKTLQKQLILPLAVFCICLFGMVCSAQAASISIERISSDRLTVNYDGEYSGKVHAYAALYDDDRNLVSVISEFDTKGSMQLDLTEYTMAHYTAKAFLWDDEMQPVAQSAETDKMMRIPAKNFWREPTRDYYETNPGEQFRIYIDSRSRLGGVSYYELTESPVLLVNGCPVEFTQENYTKYVLDNYATDILLLNDAENPRLYHTICVDYSLTAIIQSGITGSSDILTFRMSDQPDYMQLMLDKAGIDYYYWENGISGDFCFSMGYVVNIRYDVRRPFDESSFYDITGTNQKVQGKVITLDSEVGYQLNDGVYYRPYNFAGDRDTMLQLGKYYELTVDAYNRIWEAEQYTGLGIAILENAWKAEGDSDYKAKIILPDGVEKTYILENKNDLQIFGDIIWDTYDSATETKGTKKPIQNRIINYKLNSMYEISLNGDQTLQGEEISGEYHQGLGTIGEVRLDNSKILNVNQYNLTGNTADIAVVTESMLVEGETYTGYAFNKRIADNSYRFILLTEGVNKYRDDTQIAVYSRDFVTTDEAGDPVKTIEIYYDGQKMLYSLDPDYRAYNSNLGLTSGDVILFKTDLKQYITEITPVFDNNLKDGYDAFRDTVFAASGEDGTFSALFTIPEEWINTDENKTNVELAFGPIANRSRSIVTLASPVEGVSQTANDRDYVLSQYAEIYVYDYSKSGSNRLYEGTIGDIIKSGGIGINKEIIDWTSEVVKDEINFAFLKVNNDTVEQVLVILSDV